jgi:hypothetical protein
MLVPGWYLLCPACLPPWMSSFLGLTNQSLYKHRSHIAYLTFVHNVMLGLSYLTIICNAHEYKKMDQGFSRSQLYNVQDEIKIYEKRWLDLLIYYDTFTIFDYLLKPESPILPENKWQRKEIITLTHLAISCCFLGFTCFRNTCSRRLFCPAASERSSWCQGYKTFLFFTDEETKRS